MRNFIIKYFPSVQSSWLEFKAYKDVFSSKNSYSQYGEDKFIYPLIKDMDLSNGIYVDVGANHPTCISNTFLFYQKGYTGILVEPNKVLSKLLKKFRKKDVVLALGIGSEPEIAEFKYTTNHVLNSFNDEPDSKVVNTEYVPIFSLDSFIDPIIKSKWVFLLSIDIEGKELEVLHGSENLLKRTYLIVVEANTPEDKIILEKHLVGLNFVKIRDSHCNLIFQNMSFSGNGSA